MCGDVRVASCVVLVVLLAPFVPSTFAESGWYLLGPPITAYDENAQYLSGYRILDGEPLSKWSQQGAYDSASACETVKGDFLALAHRIYLRYSADYIEAIRAHKDPQLLNHMRWTTEQWNAQVNMLNASRCVKSDDSRLGQ